MTIDEYQRICDRLARKAIHYAKAMSADENISNTAVVCPKCSQPVGQTCTFTTSGQEAPDGFVHNERAVAALDAEREHWIDVFLDEHLPPVDPDVLLEVTSRPDAWVKSGGHPDASKEVRANEAFQADVWASIEGAST